MRHTWFDLNLDCLLSCDRKLIFLLAHNKLPVSERIFRVGLATDPYCETCLDGNGAVICDRTHVFCTCFKIASIWKKVKEVIINLLSCQQDIEDLRILTLNLPLNKCPGLAGFIGLYVSKVWKASGTTICEDELFGFLRYKFKSHQLDSKQQISTVNDILM